MVGGGGIAKGLAVAAVPVSPRRLLFGEKGPNVPVMDDARELKAGNAFGLANDGEGPPLAPPPPPAPPPAAAPVAAYD